MKMRWLQGLLIPCFILGKTAMAQDVDIAPALASIYDHVIVPNAKQGVQSCHALQAQLEGLADNAPNSDVLAAYRNFIVAWKKVEATYIAGEVNEEFLDTPTAIDFFHQGKENIHEQIERALASPDSADKTLFKRAHRTITALEIILFNDANISAREKAFAQYIVPSICKNLSDVSQAYEVGRDVFLADTDRALAYIAHSMATSIFALRDWRLGDPAGLTRKYQNNPSYQRSEYALSALNLAAIQAIFSAQGQVMAPQAYANMVQIMQAYKANKLSDEITLSLNNVNAVLSKLTNDKALFEPAQAKQLFDLSTQLYTHYYISLMSALPVVAKVLDADGD